MFLGKALNVHLHFLKRQVSGASAIVVLILMLFSSCLSDHLIKNSNYRAITEKAFYQRKLLASGRDSALFSVFKQSLTAEQSEALKFLFAFMPLNDLADYDGSFFLANADISLRTRTEMEWGRTIPEEIFLHYVLPYRVNNENPDSFRIAYYDELKNRIKGKSISDAALEINHWCHEKVSYQPSDIRTSGPMSTMLSARGRCGEESTFTVSALRTVGIPARQVYTPRWAHTDDNHAWVEIWINGAWSYMGACEPDCVLDRGWFTEPARRAMLVHTKSFGAYSGDENIITTNKNFADVNNLKKYAFIKKIAVKVTDENDNPAVSATVEFQLYNYAEFFPLAKVPANENGFSEFETGFGDLLIWAHKGDKFDFKKISVAETDTVKLVLHPDFKETSYDFDLDVPVIRTPFPGPSQELIKQNTISAGKENTIRQSYINSWIKPGEVKKLALSLDLDSSRVNNIIARSMGNYKEIISFLTGVPGSLRTTAIKLLEVVSDKDLRDTRRNVLDDHLLNYRIFEKASAPDNEFCAQYILNPRVANEKLVPWRKYFQTNLPAELISKSLSNPQLVIEYLNRNIRVADDENYYGTPLTPVGVNELKISDEQSRAICFVAICRSLGIASRLEPGRSIPQYFSGNIWHDVYFSGQKPPAQNKGFIKLQSFDAKPVPEYYTHFTLSRFEGGRYNTLEYEYGQKITGFKDELALPPGHYMLVTGNRLNTGKILSSVTFFDLYENQHKMVNVNIRKDNSDRKIFGKIDLEQIFKIAAKPEISQSCTKHNGLVMIWIDPDKEPTKHIFNDLPKLKGEFDSWGGDFIFLQQSDPLIPLRVTGMPENTIYGIDDQLAALKNSIKFNSSTDIVLPFVVMADKSGNIIFMSSGYRIGIGEQILKYIQ